MFCSESVWATGSLAWTFLFLSLFDRLGLPAGAFDAGLLPDTKDGTKSRSDSLGEVSTLELGCTVPKGFKRMRASSPHMFLAESTRGIHIDPSILFWTQRMERKAGVTAWERSQL